MIIVTTTINPPTEALKKFRDIADLIVVGDLKTPHESYKGWDYMSPEEQEKKYPKLSKLIGWNCTTRRNLGIVEAYNRGADVIALVDDDNIPYENWGKNYIGKEILADYYKTENKVFDPLSVTKYKHLWHRGYPIELLQSKNEVVYKGQKRVVPMVQADLWDGDPDIDAICRITYKPIVKFDIKRPYFSNRLSPFNSQNTFLAREAIPNYFLYPNTGRMEDIWASYSLNRSPFRQYPVIYAPASVYQERNEHSLVSDMKAEMIGYENNMKFLVSKSGLVNTDAYLAYKFYLK